MTITTSKKDKSAMIDRLDVDEVLRYWHLFDPSVIKEASEVFTERVKPYVDFVPNPPSSDKDLVSVLFAEWFAFDYQIARNITPLTIFLKNCSHRWSGEELELFKSIEQTQFFSQFWVVEQDPKESLTLLSNAADNNLYLVKDQLMSRNRNWSDGLLGTRIAKADDTWYMVGRIPLHDRGPEKPEPKTLIRAMAKNPARTKDYLRVVHAVVGIDGPYLDSMRVRFPGSV